MAGAKRFFRDYWTGNLKNFGWGYTRTASDEVSVTAYIELTESDTTPKGHVGRNVFLTLTPARAQKMIVQLQQKLDHVNALIASGKGSSPEPMPEPDVTDPRYGIEIKDFMGQTRYAVIRYAGNQGQKVIAQYFFKLAAENLLAVLNENSTLEAELSVKV